ncbi:MAG: DUF4386 domain-containing protein [Saprospiraceae bacterium]|nr:DUF4386 domain-containing protein [Saprospiraceae bacterium]
MKNLISNISTSKAAVVVGMAFITSIFIVTLVDDFLLANFVVPGDIEALACDIRANKRLFGFAAVGYLLVLALDAIIGLALYVVLKPANRNLASLTAVLRLLYAFTVTIGVFTLVFKIIDAHGYASIKLFGYLVFALHILVLGYAVFKAAYIPKSLGVLLMVASFTYIVFFIDFQISGIFEVVIMVMMAIAELSLSVWLILKRNSLPEVSSQRIGK